MLLRAVVRHTCWASITQFSGQQRYTSLNDIGIQLWPKYCPIHLKLGNGSFYGLLEFCEKNKLSDFLEV